MTLAVTAIDLHVGVRLLATDVAQPPRADPPSVISLPIPRGRPRTISFTFPEAPQPTAPRPAASPSARPAQPPRKPATRIQPPGDIVKLRDRLYYVLQPPLETLLASGALHFPFEPF